MSPTTVASTTPTGMRIVSVTWFGSKTLPSRESHERRARFIARCSLERPARRCHRGTLLSGWDQRSITPSGSNMLCYYQRPTGRFLASMPGARMCHRTGAREHPPVVHPTDRHEPTRNDEQVCRRVLLAPRRGRDRPRLGPRVPRNSAACAVLSSSQVSDRRSLPRLESGQAKTAASNHRSGRRHGALRPARIEDLTSARRSVAAPVDGRSRFGELRTQRAGCGVRTRHA